MNSIVPENLESHFSEVSALILAARNKSIQNVNRELINLYWQVGEYIASKVRTSDWGKSIVQELAAYIREAHPSIKGFSDKNLWRMKQFYETYFSDEKLSALLRELSWTNNLLILSKTKSVDEREYYIRLCIKENYSSRELERQIDSGLFERQVLANTNLI